MKILYRGQLEDRGIYQLHRCALISYGNGKVIFGKGSIIGGQITVVFGDARSSGEIRLGEGFVADGSVTLSPRGATSLRRKMLSDKERLLVLRNAAFNILRGSSAAVVALVLPPFLIRSLDRNTYGAWALVLQMSAYVGNLDLGVQTAVSRFVAHAI